jgi:hypothetical protein
MIIADEATCSREGIGNTRNSYWWSEENPHATVLTNFKHCLFTSVCCGIIDNQLIDPVILERDLRGRNCLEFPRNELPGLLEDGPSATRNGTYYQRDGASPHSILRVIQYLNETFPWSKERSRYFRTMATKSSRPNSVSILFVGLDKE